MMFIHTFIGLILIAVILLQRGRGGGLAGAFGGMGGQSAFGTKAGDLFTKITIVLATSWILLGGVCVLLLSNTKLQRIKLPEKQEVRVDADKKADGDVVPAPAKSDKDGKANSGESKSDDSKPNSDKKDSENPGAGKKDEKPADKSTTSDDAAKPAQDPKPEEKDSKSEEKKPVETEKPADPEKKPEDKSAPEATDKKPEQD